MLKVCGRQSQIPYYIEAIDVNVYSLEEINYFVYNHVNLVYREFFCDALFEYIEKELHKEDLAGTLRKMEQGGASIQDMIMTLLNRSGYYSAEDMSNISSMILDIDNMSRGQRLTVEADSLFREGRYDSALHIYFEILNGREKEEQPNDTFYARIAFSVGVIYARLFMSRNANAYFAKAYDLYPDPTYAKACVYMSIINHDDEELLRTIIKYRVTDDALEAIKKRIRAMEMEIEREDETKAFVEDFKRPGRSEEILEYWKNEYYTMLS